MEFAACDLNAKTAAERLHLHVNTAYYRHPSHGEEVEAFVVRTPGASITETDLIAWCRQNMAAYKYPRAVEFRDRLPMTATGKILKRRLARQPEPAGAQP